MSTIEMRMSVAAVDAMRRAAIKTEDIGKKVELLENAASVARFHRENSANDPTLDFIYGEVLLDLTKIMEKERIGRSGQVRLYLREAAKVYGTIIREGTTLSAQRNLPSEETINRLLHAHVLLMKTDYLQSKLYGGEGHRKMAVMFAQKAYWKASQFLGWGVESPYLQAEVLKEARTIAKEGVKFGLIYDVNLPREHH
jgi:hypothetical protein